MKTTKTDNVKPISLKTSMKVKQFTFSLAFSQPLYLKIKFRIILLGYKTISLGGLLQRFAWKMKSLLLGKKTANQTLWGEDINVAVKYSRSSTTMMHNKL